MVTILDQNKNQNNLINFTRISTKVWERIYQKIIQIASATPTNTSEIIYFCPYSRPATIIPDWVTRSLQYILGLYFSYILYLSFTEFPFQVSSYAETPQIGIYFSEFLLHWAYSNILKTFWKRKSEQYLCDPLSDFGLDWIVPNQVVAFLLSVTRNYSLRHCLTAYFLFVL